MFEHVQVNSAMCKINVLVVKTYNKNTILFINVYDCIINIYARLRTRFSKVWPL